MPRLQLLGNIDIRASDGAPVSPVLTQPKRLGLLAYLLLADAKGLHRRDRLTALFWPDLDQEEGRRALRQAIHFLRQHLGDDAIIARGKDEVGVDPAAVACDAVAFEDHLSRKDDAAALTLYRGDLLAGFHVAGASPDLEEWLGARRRGLREAARAAARRLADSAAKEDRLPEALRWAHWALDLPESEDADALRVMALFDRAGDPAGGLAEYRRYAKRLAEELGAEPGRAVRDAAKRLESLGRPDTPPLPRLGRPDTPQQPLGRPDRPPLQPPGGGQPEQAAAARPPRRWAMAAIAFVAVLAAAAALIRRKAPPEAPGAADPVRVAVTPFSNRTGAADLDGLGPVAAEWIARGVVRIPGVEVQSVATGREPAGVTIIIRGSYYRASRDSLRYAAEIVETATGKILRIVDPVLASAALPLAGLEEMRDRLTSAVGTIVDPVPTPLFEAGAMPPRYDAWREYVRGQEAYWAGNLPEALPALLHAAALDSTYTEALVFAGVVATGLWQCGIVDSVQDVLERAGDRVSELERITAGISAARCQADWPEALSLQRRRAALLPGSTLAKWSVAMVARQAGRPREALGLLQEIDPARDLTWLGEAGRSLYWREITAASHALGDYREEEKLAAAIRPPAGTPLAAAMLRARSLAGQQRFPEAVAAMQAVVGLAADPALASGLAPRGMRPAMLATPGWALYQVATELAAHGATTEAQAMAARAVAWVGAQSAPLANSVEQRYVKALALLLTGDDAAARSLLAVLAGEDSTSVDLRGSLGVADARLGDEAAASKTIAWLRGLRGARPVGGPAYYEAAILAALGRIEPALRALERLPHGAHPYNSLALHADPLLAPLRGSEAFANLTRPQG